VAKMIFINLPVADVAKSTAFYEAIGFTRNLQFSNEVASCMVMSEAISVMILGRDFFQTFTPKTIADAHASTEVLLATMQDSRAEADALVAAAAQAGGVADPRPVQDLGFMYSRSFEDLDGHMWEVGHMDMAAYDAAGGPNAELPDAA
jgi:predicted lactoylglutathione lyase